MIRLPRVSSNRNSEIQDENYSNLNEDEYKMSNIKPPSKFASIRNKSINNFSTKKDILRNDHIQNRVINPPNAINYANESKGIIKTPSKKEDKKNNQSNLTNELSKNKIVKPDKSILDKESKPLKEDQIGNIENRINKVEDWSKNVITQIDDLNRKMDNGDINDQAQKYSYLENELIRTTNKIEALNKDNQRLMNYIESRFDNLNSNPINEDNYLECQRAISELKSQITNIVFNNLDNYHLKIDSMQNDCLKFVNNLKAQVNDLKILTMDNFLKKYNSDISTISSNIEDLKNNSEVKNVKRAIEELKNEMQDLKSINIENKIKKLNENYEMNTNSLNDLDKRVNEKFDKNEQLLKKIQDINSLKREIKEPNDKFELKIINDEIMVIKKLIVELQKEYSTKLNILSFDYSNEKIKKLEEDVRTLYKISENIENFAKRKISTPSLNEISVDKYSPLENKLNDLKMLSNQFTLDREKLEKEFKTTIQKVEEGIKNEFSLYWLQNGTISEKLSNMIKLEIESQITIKINSLNFLQNSPSNILEEVKKEQESTQKQIGQILNNIKVNNEKLIYFDDRINKIIEQYDVNNSISIKEINSQIKVIKELQNSFQTKLNDILLQSKFNSENDMIKFLNNEIKSLKDMDTLILKRISDIEAYPKPIFQNENDKNNQMQINSFGELIVEVTKRVNNLGSKISEIEDNITKQGITNDRFKNDIEMLKNNPINLINNDYLNKIRTMEDTVKKLGEETVKTSGDFYAFVNTMKKQLVATSLSIREEFDKKLQDNRKI